MTRRQWERDYLRDAFIGFGMVIDGIAHTARLPWSRRVQLSVTLKGYRVICNLPEIRSEVKKAWAKMVTKRELAREWARHKKFSLMARKMGRAFGESLRQMEADVLAEVGR